MSYAAFRGHRSYSQSSHWIVMVTRPADGYTDSAPLYTTSRVTTVLYIFLLSLRFGVLYWLSVGARVAGGARRPTVPHVSVRAANVRGTVSADR